MAVLAIPNVLREKLGEPGAQALVELLNHAEDRAKDRTLEIATERYERRLVEEIAKLRVELHGIRAEIIKWNMATIIAVAGLTMAIVKLVG